MYFVIYHITLTNHYYSKSLRIKYVQYHTVINGIINNNLLFKYLLNKYFNYLFIKIYFNYPKI